MRGAGVRDGRQGGVFGHVQCSDVPPAPSRGDVQQALGPSVEKKKKTEGFH